MFYSSNPTTIILKDKDFYILFPEHSNSTEVRRIGDFIKQKNEEFKIIIKSNKGDIK